MALREHNRIALELSKLNPKWDDETIFQTARKILIGAFQHITVWGLMPLYISKDLLYRHNILYLAKGFVNDYDDSIDPAPYDVFSQGGFRQGHSMIAGFLE